MELLIPEQNLGKLRRRITAASKAAAKCGTELHYAELWNYSLFRTQLDDCGFERTREYRYKAVSVEGEAPHLAGWHFVARIEHMRLDDGTVENLLYIAPSEETEVPAKYRTVGTHCDHCEKQRWRKDTFVVRNEEGEYRQVGRSCLKDFIGHKDPKDILSFYTFLSDLGGYGYADEDSWGAARGVELYRREQVLDVAAAEIAANGFVSRKNAAEWDKPATSGMVFSYFNPPQDAKARKYWEEDVRDPINAKRGEDTAKLAEEVLAWGREQEGNDYLINLRILARTEQWEGRHFGLGVSMISAYRRAQESEAERAKREAEKAARKPSEWVGEIKKRQEMTVTVKRLIGIDSFYGHTVLHIMEDTDGNSIKWFCSGEPLEEGATVKVKATPKKHDEYKGEKQTIVTRVTSLQ